MNAELLLEKFFEQFPDLIFGKNKLIIDAGKEPDGMYYVSRGLVRQFIKTPTGGRVNLHIYKPGSCFPLMWLFNSTANKYYYECITETSVKKAPSERVKQFIVNNIDLMEYFMSRLLLGIDGLLTRLESLIVDKVYERTVLLFLYFAKSFGTRAGDTIKITMPLTHEEIAAWLGVARETASLQVEKLRRKKLIQLEDRRYIIRNTEALYREIEPEQTA